MPQIDLWAVETNSQISGDETGSSDGMNLTRADMTVCSSRGQIMESVVQSVQASGFKEEVKDKDSVQRPSHAWTTFIEQAEVICVNTSLVILVSKLFPFFTNLIRLVRFWVNFASVALHLK